MLLLIYLMYFDCLWEFCECLCFVMHYFVSILVLQSSCRGRESWLLCYCCLADATINGLWLFLTVPWLGMQYVIVVFPDHTHLLLSITPGSAYFEILIEKNLHFG